MPDTPDINIVFFGSSSFSIFCLEELKKHNLLPALIITTPDKPVGRGLKMEANPVKTWAEANNIECLTPNRLDSEFVSQLTPHNCNLALVASYGKIIPASVIDLPKYGTLNIHPSLLPKYRGPSPLQKQIINDEQNIGVTVMKIDEQVDHGAIVAQEKMPEVLNHMKEPVSFDQLEIELATAGIKLFIKILPDWIEGKIKATEQNHAEATFTKKILKSDGELDIESGGHYKNYLKYLAYADWPQTYFFVEKNGIKIRVKIKEAEFTNNLFVIKKVLPEGKKEMNYEDFLRGL